MKKTHRLMLVTSLLAFTSWVLVSPMLARAQAVGNDAVYNSTSGITFSPSFVDASMLLPPHSNLGKDLCDAIYGLMSGQLGFPPYPSTGAVIDARGIRGASNLTCTHGTPWNEGSSTVSLPSTILLPATGGATPNPILISTPWILPANTHLIGEGDGTPSSGSTPGTTIQAASGFSGSMIQFGSSSCPVVSNVPICTGISVENLTLDGRGQLGQTVTGITNAYSQDISYVNHVSLYRTLGTGLLITSSGQSNANGSGPYANIDGVRGVAINRQSGPTESPARVAHPL